MKIKKESNSKHEAITERYVSIKAVSRYTSLAESTLYEWSAQGKVPSIKIGRRVLFDLHDIDKVMTSMRHTNNKEENIVEEIVGGTNGNNV